MVTDTIVAQCTPSGSGAIALIRVSGPHALEVVHECAKLSSKKNLFEVATHTIHHGSMVNINSDIIDEVMFFVMHAPKTFTGEHVVEITTHNNTFIISSVIERLIECGARMAQQGEFSRQAVLNNKIDLLQAEAINDVIHANSELALKQSLEQLKGSFSQWITTIEKDTLKLRALCEATFEFLEEDIDFSDQIKESTSSLIAKIDVAKKTFDQQQRLREGVRIAIVGSVNAGKSSLFNQLLKKDRAIVTCIAGTTRDVIEGGLYKDGIYWTLIDTAGIRKTDDVIEKEGIERAYHETKNADVVLLVVDGSVSLSDEEKNTYHSILEQFKDKIIPVINKVDLNGMQFSEFESAHKISTKTGLGIDQLEESITKKVRELFAYNKSPFLLNTRHFNLLTAFERELFVVETMIKSKPEYELIAYHLKNALGVLSEMTGKTVDEKMLDTVFKDFCVGK